MPLAPDSRRLDRLFTRRICFALLSLLLAALSLVGSGPAALASGTLSRVHLFIAGKELDSKTSPVGDDTEIYAPLEILRAVGAVAQLSPHGDTLVVTEQITARTLELAPARINGVSMIALSDLAHLVDGAVVRAPARKASAGITAYFAARILNVSFDGSRVQVSASFPIRFRVEPTPAGGTSTIVCAGAVLDGYHLNRSSGIELSETRSAEVKVAVALPDRKGLGAVATNDVPVEKLTASLIDVPRTSIQPETETASQPVKHPDKAISPAAAQPAGPPQSSGPRNEDVVASVLSHDGFRFGYPDGALDAAPPGIARSASTAPVEVTDLAFVTDGGARARVEVGLSGKAAVAVRYVPGTTRMEIEIANASINLRSQEDADRTFQNSLLDRLSIVTSARLPSNALVLIDTTRILGYTLATSQNRITLDLRVPRNASGALSDKLIVVDAGHGGAATGAAGDGSNGRVYEKTITLAMALKLRACLEKCGARVVMTRDSDLDVPLYDRPKLANTIGADLFISIHNDSTPHLNSASGTTTYYHAADPSSRALAECVQQAVHSVTGLPGKGALSDNVLYASGLAVLRASSMPSVLCEVAYINNAGDRAHLVDPAFQQRVAQAMCDGLRAYVEGRPRSTVREQPTSQLLPEAESPGQAEPDSLLEH